MPIQGEEREREEREREGEERGAEEASGACSPKISRIAASR